MPRRRPERARPVVSGPSIRDQLFKPMLWVWLVGLAGAVLGAYLMARVSVNAAFDRGLQDEVRALAARIEWSDRGPLLDISTQTMELLGWDREDRNGFVMVDVEGNPLAGDSTVPVPEPEVLRWALQQPTLFDQVLMGESVRGAVFSVSSPMLDRTISLIVVETKKKRNRILRDLQLSIVFPAFIMGIITFSMLGWGIRRGLRPLTYVAAEVARRDMRDWRPLPLSTVPREAVPLIERINHLLADMEQSIELQRRFVADAAHQLRTPVAGIRVLAQTLASELESLEPSLQAHLGQSRPLAAQLDKAAERMARLIGQLLSLARSETALAQEADLPVADIVAVVRESAEPLLDAALRAGKTLALDAPSQGVVARAHPIWLGEVVKNILDNALRYGGAHISIRVRNAVGGGAVVVLEDDGAGVAQDQLRHLFEPFWRGERADTRNDGGTGLGLTIAREILVRMGGSIEAFSRPEVNGLRFEVVLPG
ncbi:sensor histidine kinase [Ideonella livida]|uniref:histidine kinase n=1 Tax=Ideonella livida TaxID=2707176 RepID=A0A7C9PIQ7_9BURK|nr:sensor histidine kinase [Ideonella livida]NDY92154.1 sensor histidine kinase [Ideonella livida]